MLSPAPLSARRCIDLDATVKSDQTAVPVIQVQILGSVQRKDNRVLFDEYVRNFD